MRPPKQRLPEPVEKWWFNRVVENHDADELRLYLQYRSLTDLVFFARVVLGYDLLGDAYHYYLAWQLERWQKLFKHIEGPRETYKSVLTTSWEIREIIKNPDITIMQVGEDETIAKKALNSVRGQFESNKRLIALFGDFTGSGDWSQERLVVSKRSKHIDNPTVQISSPEITRTGAHPELIVCDDLEGERCYKSDAYNRRVADRDEGYFSALFGMLRKPFGRMLVVNTPWRFDGVCLGRILNEQDGISKLFDSTAIPVRHLGRYIMPHIFSDRRIEELIATFGPANVSVQYDLWPMANSSLRFRPEFMQRALTNTRPRNADGKTLPMNCYVLLDPSGGIKEGNDPAGLVCIGLPPGQEVYILHAEKLRREVGVVCARVLEVADRAIGLTGEGAIGVEANAGLIAYVPELRRLMKLRGGRQYRIETVRPNRTAKSARIAGLIGLYDAGFLKVMGAAMEFARQMQSYGIGEDDLVDAAAYWNDPELHSSRPRIAVEPTPAELAQKKIEDREREILDEVTHGKFNDSVLVGEF